MSKDEFVFRLTQAGFEIKNSHGIETSECNNELADLEHGECCYIKNNQIQVHRLYDSLIVFSIDRTKTPEFQYAYHVDEIEELVKRVYYEDS